MDVRADRGAVSFDGTNDYIDTDNGSALDSLTELSYAAWIYPTSNSGYILAKRNNGGGEDGFRLTSGNLQGWFSNFSADSAGRSTSSTSVTLSTWSHVAMTYSHSGDKKVRLYINGSEVAYSEQDTNSNGADTDASYDFYIGTSQLLATPFTGSVDEVRIYSRTLSADEVSQLYALTAPTGTDTSLRGYWSFNGQDVSGTTAYDRSGAGNNGTLTNGPSITEGKIGQGLSFDGVDDYVDTTSTTAFNSATITVSAWVRPDVGNTLDTVVSRDNSGSLRNWNLGNGASANTFRFAVFISNTQYNAESAAGFSTGVWHHLVGTYDGTNVRLYVDGVNTATTAQAGSLDTDAIQVTIGRRGNVDEPWDGLIDEVRIYNTALTAAQIAALYNQSR